MILAFLYLGLCFTTGWAICSVAFPNLTRVAQQDYERKKIPLSPALLFLPAWFITGTLAMTWITYLTAYLYSQMREPLLAGNAVSMTLGLAGTVLAVYYHRIEKKKKSEKPDFGLFCKDKRSLTVEMILITSVVLLASVLMWTTFYMKGDNIYIGVSVFSDFSPHIGMIRSFSYGNNFPTTYSHFAGEDIKYHFMFQFLTGNLEFLGMRLDYAFNIPSILSFTFAFLLLYVLALKITGNIGAGILACLFFAFRSSNTLFLYLAHLPAGTKIGSALFGTTDFLGTTPNEEWGLWNLNVYCNQRHLAFGIAVILFVFILFLPSLYETFAMIKEENKISIENDNGTGAVRFHRRGRTFRMIFFTREGWAGKHIRESVALGMILGCLAFFHGAAEIAGLLVLFAVGVLARRRMELILAAVIAVILTMLQTKLFIHSSMISAKFLFGFLAENKTMLGVASYLWRLLGILPFVLLAAFFIEKAAGKYLMLAFALPLVFAFTISLTVDVTVNHKYIMISCILLGIFAAAVVVKMLKQGNVLIRLAGVILIFVLTVTGVYDFTTVIRKNWIEAPIVLDNQDPMTNWIRQNSNSQDLFLTSDYSINQVVLGGAMLYLGWEYFGWSAGYDTDGRAAMVRKMYEADTPAKLDELVKENKIRFIIIDGFNRNSQDYQLNEQNIRKTYQCVVEFGKGVRKRSVFDTTMPIYIKNN